MNRIDKLFRDKQKNILSIYFTAGYPKLHDTVTIIEELAKNGVDLIEIGVPFSDPVADGPVIQKSNLAALHNGMTVKKLFNQLRDIRKLTDIPLILMSYFNPIHRFGVDDFCARCAETGIDGLIIPDLPVSVYNDVYKEVMQRHGLYNILLITPQTSEERTLHIDATSQGFIYMVSSQATTGMKSSIDDYHSGYFERIRDMELKNPRLIGFGISNRETFENACVYAHGGIIGSAFIRALEESSTLEDNISAFINAVNFS